MSEPPADYDVLDAPPQEEGDDQDAAGDPAGDGGDPGDENDAE
jgi:hypothetical protein